MSLATRDEEELTKQWLIQSFKLTGQNFGEMTPTESRLSLFSTDGRRFFALSYSGGGGISKTAAEC